MDKDDKAVSNFTGLEDKGFQSQLNQNLKEAKRDVESDKELNRLGESATTLVYFLCRYHTWKRVTETRFRKILEEVGEYLAQNGAANLLKVYFDIYSDEESKKDWAEFERLLLVCLNFSDSSAEFSEKIAASGILSNLIAFLRKYRESFPQKLETEGIIIRWSAGILYNCSIPSNNKIFFNDLKTINLIIWYAKNAKMIEINELNSKLLTSFCMLTLAHINDEKNSNRILTDDEIISYILEILNEALLNSNHRSSGFSAQELTSGLTKLANNDQNSFKILQSGVLSSLKKLINTDNFDEQIAAVKCIWALSFVEENKSMITHETEVMKKLEELKSHDLRELRSSAINTLWELRVIPNKRDVEQYLPTYEQKHVMLSYNWDNQSTMKKIKDRLVSRGYSVWMDEDKMKGDTLDAMADAVERSSVVLICMSQKYKDSLNCKSEASYAFKRKKDIIPLKLQEGFDANGWLGLIVGTKLYFSFHDPKSFDDSLTKLIKEIGDRGKSSAQEVVDSPILPIKAVQELEEASPETYEPQTSHSVRIMKSEEVQQWAKDLGLEPSYFKNLDGNALLFLHSLKSEAPEFFYKLIGEQLHIKSVKELTIFTKALEKLN